jgi:hypothetical protein
VATRKKRAQPGAKAEGDYYHVLVRAKGSYVGFRTQDVGDPGHIQRVAGKRADGTWETVKWLISKEDAHVERGRLVPDNEDAKELLASLGAGPRRIEGDRFAAQPVPELPGRASLTPGAARPGRPSKRRSAAGP